MQTRAVGSSLLLSRLSVSRLGRPIRLTVLGDVHCEDMVTPMRLAGCEVTFQPFAQFSSAAFWALAESKDVLAIDVSTSPQSILPRLNALIAAIGISNVRPRVLCYSTLHRNPDFISGVQKCGARYVRVSDPTMLLEAVDLLLWEMKELEQNGPCFRITHKYSEGLCAPGEEVSATDLLHEGDSFHLPLALTERLVVEVLARHQRIALDSSQIVSTISAEWFFRDHAANSGHRQVKKLKRPTVKVSVERIRNALSLVFDRAGLRFDPYDVLRSCLAEGTNRVLYRLHGRIDWFHPKNIR